jgi:hypothetical protein
MPNSSDVEHNISFSHPYLSIVDHWEKFKRIEKTLHPTYFRVFIVDNTLTKNSNIISLELRDIGMQKKHIT